MKDILISTAIILFIGIAGSLLFQALTAPHMPVTGTLMHPTMSHNAAFATRPVWALPLPL
jgi:hypothetical protein